MTSGDQEPAKGEDQEPAAEEGAPALNREQRRALARGKKGGAPGQAAGPLRNVQSGGNRGSGHAGQVSLPRTGHK